MFYKLLVLSLVTLLFSVGTVLAGEHGKKSHDSQTMGSEHSKRSESHSQHNGHEKKHIVKKLVSAVSKTGLNAQQVEQVTQAINQFKLTKLKIKSQKQFPLDAFKEDAFDKQAFKNHWDKFNAMKVQAKSDLFEQIYSILDAEQKKIFKREFTAPMIEKMIKKNMLKGKNMKSDGMTGDRMKGKQNRH